jgi:site-specific recombinase XerD
MLMKSYLSAFADFRRINMGNSQNTVDSYVFAVRQFADFLAHRELSLDPDKVLRQDIDDFMQALFKELRCSSPNSMCLKLSALRAFFKFLVHKQVILLDPTEGVPSPKRPKLLPKKFSTSELKRLLGAPSISTQKGLRDKALLMTVYGAGLRKSELVNLDIGNLDDTGAFIHVAIFGKGSKERTVTLLRRPAAVLRQWLLERQRLNPVDSAVFIRTKATPARLNANYTGTILKKYGFKMGFQSTSVFMHKLRSTWATDLYDAGFGLLEICALAGWSDVKTAQSYVRISERARRKTAIPDRRWKELESPADEAMNV